MSILILVIIIVCVYLGALTYTIIKVSKDVKEEEQKHKSKVSFFETYKLTGLPIITMKSGKKDVNFMVDTGSSNSFIDSSLIPDIDVTELPCIGKVAGLGKKVLETHFYNIKLNLREKLDFEFEFQAFDFSSTIPEQKGIEINGILGSDFFDKYKYVIDFKEYIAYTRK